jgi:hypothetical protein
MECQICREERGWSLRDGPFDVEVLRIPRAADGLLARCAEPVRRAGHTAGVAPLLDSLVVAWFRWIVGHQLLFMQWRLLGASLYRVLGRGVPGPGMGSADGLIDLCSVLLLYCGSCTPAGYLDVLRPTMARRHPAFSGEWATDFHAIPGLVRAVVDSDRSVRHVRAAWRLNQRVHAAVANRLVPGQPSLLRQAGRRLGAGPTAEEADAFDSFFRTRRDVSCGQGFCVQLSRWLAKVLGDLACFGLYYDSAPVSVGVRGGYGERIAYLESRAVGMLTDQADAVREYLGGGDG